MAEQQLALSEDLKFVDFVGRNRFDFDFGGCYCYRSEVELSVK
jgi:hypothetical protein